MRFFTFDFQSLITVPPSGKQTAEQEATHQPQETKKSVKGALPLQKCNGLFCL